MATIPCAKSLRHQTNWKWDKWRQN